MTMLLLNVFGGLAIFIFGMKLMSDGLRKAAGERMRSILRFFASNRFVAILSGALVTAVIQSSSASTVMVIGFVNAGLLNLAQSIGIIFGANIGTTITAQLVAFEISWIIMPAIIVGLLVGFLEPPIPRGWGETIIGFGFLFLGMSIMSDELKQLSTNPAFTAVFRTFDCAPQNGWIPPGALFGAIGIGLAATMIIQSSSACTGIIIALGAGGLINLYTAVALVLGSNIGTTITAQLAAIPANRIAKQAALAHTLFNVIGVALIVPTFWLRPGESDLPLFFRLVDSLGGAGDLPRRIANAHTLFNVLTTLVLLPFIPLLAKVCERLIPKISAKVKYHRLEPLLLETPAIALGQSIERFRKMLRKAWKMVDCALESYDNPQAVPPEKVRKLERKEERIDELQEKITGYLTALMQKELSPAQSLTVPALLHCTNDAERIGDHTEVLVHLLTRLNTEETPLSGSAKEEFRHLHTLLRQQVAEVFSRLSPDAVLTTSGLGTDADLSAYAAHCEDMHVQRMSRGECHPASGVIYLELLAEFVKISRHLTNISDRAEVLRIMSLEKGKNT